MSPVKFMCCLSILGLAAGQVPDTPALALALRPSGLPAAQPAPSLRDVWTLFAAAVVKNDVATIRALSARKIRCVACVDNTPTEEAAWEAYRSKHPKTWYDKLYKELANVDIDVFIQQDVPGVFDKRTKSRLLDPSKAIVSESQKPQEVLVTIGEPAGKGGGGEGMQAAFAFEQTKDGYRFCGYSTIP